VQAKPHEPQAELTRGASAAGTDGTRTTARAHHPYRNPRTRETALSRVRGPT